jgi:hypothetical protein
MKIEKWDMLKLLQEWGRGKRRMMEGKVNSTMIYCKNFGKCHNCTPSTILIKNKTGQRTWIDISQKKILNKHMKRCSTSVIEKCKLNPKYHFILIKIVIKQQKESRESCEKNGPLVHYWCYYYGKQNRGSSKKMQNRITF